MKITFDSNVWEKVVSPLEENDSKFLSLNKLISSKKINPYICEIAISLESIRRMKRFEFWKNYKPKTEIERIDSRRNEDGTTTIHNRAIFAPNNESHPGLNPKLKERLFLANDLGFKVLRMTNIGTVRSNEIPDDMLASSESLDDFWEYAHKVADCATFINKMGCGAHEYHCLKEEYGLSGATITHIIKKIDKTQYKRFSKAIGEFVDGDSLAAHYASGNDIFCTEDRGRNAGQRSIFSTTNVSRIKKRFNLQILGIDDVLNILL